MMKDTFNETFFTLEYLKKAYKETPELVMEYIKKSNLDISEEELKEDETKTVE